MNHKNKRILLIAYYYPPFNNGGTQRIINFRKYLPQYGYDVDIVTTNALGSTDDEKGIYRYADVGWSVARGNNKLIAYPMKVFKRIMVRLGLVGDETFFWKHEILNNIHKDVDMSSYDFILASFPQQTNLEIGLYLSKKFEIPLIVDYRDGLMYNPFKYIIASPFSKRRAQNLEKELAAYAPLQITINSVIGNYYRKMYETKTIDIPNGFDDEEEFPFNEFEFPNGYNIVYTGALSLSRDNYSLSYLCKIIEGNEGVNFIFIGNYTKEEKENFRKYKNVFIYQPMERKKIIPIQRESDILLLVTGDDPSGMTGKLFEYLFAKKPILNLGGNNVAAKIINETDSGKTIHPEEVKEVHQFINDVKNNQITFSHRNLSQYTRREQCKRLAQHLDQLN